MKTFAEYLMESKKIYSFKLGFAGELPESFQERLETGLKKFEISKLSKGKKTPIQERPLDFPQLQNTEVTYYEVDLVYPTTSQVLKDYLGKVCSVHESHIVVKNTGEPYEEQQTKEEKNEPYEPILTKEELEGESAQDSVAGNRVMSLIKELEAARKERQHDPAAAAPTGESKDIDSSENTKSAVGS